MLDHDPKSFVNKKILKDQFCCVSRFYKTMVFLKMILKKYFSEFYSSKHQQLVSEHDFIVDLEYFTLIYSLVDDVFDFWKV